MQHSFSDQVVIKLQDPSSFSIPCYIMGL